MDQNTHTWPPDANTDSDTASDTEGYKRPTCGGKTLQSLADAGPVPKDTLKTYKELGLVRSDSGSQGNTEKTIADQEGQQRPTQGGHRFTGTNIFPNASDESVRKI